MLTKLLVRDETTASLGKTEQTFNIRDWGKTFELRELIGQRVIQKVEE